MGGSIQRSIYQDLIQPLQGNTFPNYTMLRMKSEDAKTFDSTSSRKYFPKSHYAEDEERRLLPKRQAAGWRNEREGQKEDRPQRSQTISHRLLFLTVCFYD